MFLQENYFMATTTEFCEDLRLFCQYWENMDEDKIVGYCRKNLLKPVRIRKKDICQCITGKIRQESQGGNTQPNSMTVVI